MSSKVMLDEQSQLLQAIETDCGDYWSLVCCGCHIHRPFDRSLMLFDLDIQSVCYLLHVSK